MMFRSILSGKATTPWSADAFLKAVSEAGQQARIAEAKRRYEVIGSGSCQQDGFVLAGRAYQFRTAQQEPI